MPPNYRQQQGAPLLAHERRGAVLLAGLLVAAGAVAGFWELSSAGNGSPAGRCVSIVVASSTGGGELRRCGKQARTWCAGQARPTGPFASQAQEACRRAGFARSG
jgi:hypothetical protein